MNKLLVATTIVGAAAAGVYFYMRNRNATARGMSKLADAAGDAHEGVRKYFRKANREARQELQDAIA